MARPEKIAQVEAIAAHLQSAQSTVLADYSGTTVAQMTEFRAKCREKHVVCRVVKNRLAKIAADKADLPQLKEHLSGPIALIMGPESQVDPARLVVDFAKDVATLEVRGGFMDGGFLSPAQVVALSLIPSRDVLYAKMMGSINSPLSGIACVTSGVLSALARATDAVAKQKAS
ncbi:50S ribosomal protein L10 [bacterium]|nr:50S ribosomal protein L10 [bacterium]MBU1074378.1 50S ribosomal protein L10 [bacterium]MBU1676046.1 50S ribosomal protein L10 [bacterium]